MDIPKLEPKINFMITEHQAMLILMGLSAGTIQIASFQQTMSTVFYEKQGEAKTKELLTEFNKIGMLLQAEMKKLNDTENPTLKKV